MTRHRAQRLAEISRSKGVKATALAAAPNKKGASTPFLYLVLLRAGWSKGAVWCYSTTHFFTVLKTLLADRPDATP